MAQLCSSKSLKTIVIAALVAVALARPTTASAATTEIGLSLMKFTKVTHLDAGASAGVSPSRVVVHVGDWIVFANQDSSHHTATGLVAATRPLKFVDSPKWTDTALKFGGAIGTDVWSTGDLAPGARSQPMKVDRPGTYLYGCFFDYGAGMRGEIVVEP